MIDTNYVQAGINIAKCGHCGMDSQGKPRKNGGNLFIPIDLKLYALIRHTCDMRLEGSCHRCGKKSFARFIHQLAPRASEESIKAISKAVQGKLK